VSRAGEERPRSIFQSDSSDKRGLEGLSEGDAVRGCLSQRVAIKVEKARKNVAPDRLAVSFRAAR